MTDTAQITQSADPVLIVGLGETGVAAARWCARQGRPLRIADTRAEPAGLDALRVALGAHVAEFHLGCETFPSSLLDNVAQIVLSPGLSPLLSPVKELLAEAASAGIEVIGEIELFARALGDLAQSRQYIPRVVAITGTNGKTTVTALTRHLLEAAGISARAAGNISPSGLHALMDALDSDDLPAAWVLELSSFQLMTTRSLRLEAAVVLNVTQDHLDWHGSMQAYADAKAEIYRMAETWIVNRDDALVTNMVPELAASNVRSFGRDVPMYCADLGIETSQDVQWLVSAEPIEFDEDLPATPRRKKNAPPPARKPGRISRLMPADALAIRGLHNALNCQAALLLARSLGCGWGPLLRAAGDYVGEPHRMEFVRTVRGVDFFNDSKGTNVGATVAGLEGLGRKSVLIAGGVGKGQDFSPLAPVVARHARAVVLIGQDAPIIMQNLGDTGVECVVAESMHDAVTKAFSRAAEGDAVLLSPACASFDMFRNYPHRGRVFVDAVQELALEQGEVV